jgi:hypothetical protein
MSNKSGYQSVFSSVNVWGLGPVVSTLRITGKSIINLLEVIGDTLFKGFVYFSNDVHFENLPTSSVYSPTQINQFATKQYVDSVFVGEGIDIFDSNNTWSGTNTWEGTCTFDMGQFKFFSIGTEENVVAGINTFSTETRFSANAMNINGEEYVYITGAGDVTIKGGGFGAPNPEGGGLIGGTLNITSALTTLESSTAITIEATNITITGAVESASITEEIGLAVEVEEDRAVAAELVLEEEIGVLQGEVEALQGEIAGLAVGGGGAIAILETEILNLQYRVANTTGGGRVDTSEIHFYQTNGSGNRGTISMVERDGETKIRMHDPVDFDKSIYIDEGHYISSHGDVDIRDGQKAFKGNYLRAFYHTEHPLHIGTDSSGGDGEVWIEGTINLFTKSIPRMKPTLSLVPTMDNELSTKFYVDTSITNAITVSGSAVTLGGDQILLGGVKTFTNLPVCSTFASDQNQFTTKGSVESILSNSLINYASLSGNETFLSGVKTFTDLPQCAVVPTSNFQFANKKYVDDALSGSSGGGTYVTTNTDQEITGPKFFLASTTTFGNAGVSETTPRVAILNNTTSDSSVSGSINNEAVYHQIQFGDRKTYISQGVDKDNTYIGQSDGTVPDPNFQLTLRRGVGLKISDLGTDTNSFTEALKVIGTQRVTGISTFDVSPICSENATQGNQLTNKTYVDNAISTAGTSYVTLGTAQNNISGSKTFTGNCVIWPTSGTTIIRGAQADIYADVTYLTGGTTTISGNNCNIIGSNTYFGGALVNMRSTTINIGLVKTNPAINTYSYLQSYYTIVDSNVYSFYIDAEYSNFVGDNTLLQSPYTAVTNACTSFSIAANGTSISSPYVAITNACTSLNLNATNTFITGNVTAPTVGNTDNSTNVATTAFVNSYGNANYMTIGTNQTINGVKTYTSKQTFSAGTDIGGASVTSNFTGTINVPDQTTGTNSTVAANTKFVNSSITTSLNSALANYVSIAGDQSVTGFKNFTKAVSTPVETSFVNLNTSTDPYAFFPMTRKFFFSDEYKTEEILISANYTAGYSSKFSIEAHYLLFNAEPSAILDLTEPLLVNYYVYDNTLSQTFTSTTLRFGIPDNYIGELSVPTPGQTWRFVGNFDDTYDKNCFFERTLIAGHSYTFSYKITAYVYAAGNFSVSSNFRYRVETTRSIESVNYNYFCNPYSCFFKNVFCGAWMIEGSGATATRIPLYYSCVDASNVFGTETLAFEPQIQLTSFDIPNNGAVGEISYFNIDNTDNNYEIYPNYGLVVYQNVMYEGSVYLNYKNTGKNPIWVKPSIINRISSYRVFYMDKEILRNDEVV